MKHIVIAGGNGMIGKLLQKYFTKKNYRITVLTRNHQKVVEGINFVHWDGETLGAWTQILEGADVLINLAGRSVDCRYTKKNRDEIYFSRILSTRILGLAMEACTLPPRVWMNMSTATIYQHRKDCPNDECHGLIGAHPDAKDQFSVKVAKDWEMEFNEQEIPGVRRIVLRSAMVMDKGDNSVYSVLKKLTQWGLGGPMGDGTMYVSWIHGTDFCRVIEYLICNEELKGVFNVAAPEPIQNKNMMQLFREHVRMRFGIPATKWMLEVGAFFLRTETELIIKSRFVIPVRLLDKGFRFEYTHMKQCIESFR